MEGGQEREKRSGGGGGVRSGAYKIAHSRHCLIQKASSRMNSERPGERKKSENHAQK